MAAFSPYHCSKLCGAVLLACQVLTAPAAPVRLAVPFTIDRTMTASSMAVEMETENLQNRPLAEVTAATNHPSAAAFQTLTGHLAANQPEAAAAMMRQGAFQSPEDALSYARNYAAAFQDGWSTATVHRRYDAGEESWISWQVPQGGKSINRIFRFTDGGGQWRWADDLLPGNTRSMQTLVSASEQLGLDNAPGVHAVEGMDFRHSVAVPGMKAKWLFNGFATTWDAFGAGPVPDHPVTRVYATAARALYAGDLAAFAAAHLPFSAQRVTESINAMDAAQKAGFMDAVRKQGRKVTFVLEALPVFVVFYETEGRGLQYDTLFAPGGDMGRLQLCNFFVESFMDEIMKDQGFFQDPVIRLLAGRPEDPPHTGAAAPPSPGTNPPGSVATPAGSVPVPVPGEAGTDPDKKGQDAGKIGSLTPRAWILLITVLIAFFIRSFRPKS